MLGRLWADHRNACLVSLALLVVGVVVTPWVLLAAVVGIIALVVTYWALKKRSSKNRSPNS